MLSVLGSLLVVWQYHLGGDPQQAGLYFLALDLGFLLASFLSSRVLRRVGWRMLALLSCTAAAGVFSALPVVAPPVPISWRLLYIGGVGLVAGSLATALLHCLQRSYPGAPGSAIGRSALLFSAGSCSVTALTGAIYSAGKSGWEISALACIPALTLLAFVRRPALPNAMGPPGPLVAKTRNLRALATVLFSLLLLLQLGNEWAIAGWLPILLIRRLGTDPSVAIFCLAFYFLFVALGRIVAQSALFSVSHRRLLLASVVVAMVGYALLATTYTFSAAFAGIVLIGFGFGPIFPLLGRSMDERIVWQPGCNHGIFSFAITGAMAVPWLLGYVFEYLGNNFLLAIPALGSVLVFLLVLLLMLERRLMHGTPSGGQSELLY